MEKVHIVIFLLISSLMLIADAQFLFEKREKTAEFRVYAHDVLGGPNATVHEVARSKITSTSPTFFGLVLAADDLVTIGPDLNSQKLGRAQGLVINSDMDELAIALSGVFIFTAGKYSGSTLVILGWKLATGEDQMIPIVGGTGIFRLARGHAISNVYSYDPTTKYYVMSFDMYVVYEE